MSGLEGLVLTAPFPAWGDVHGTQVHWPDQQMTDGLQAFQRGDFEAAAASWKHAVQGYDTAQQAQAQRIALIHLAQALESLGHSDLATERLQVALQLAETAGAQSHVALALSRLAELALAKGNLKEAARLLQNALTRAHSLDDDGLTATLLHTRGNLLMVETQWHEALAAYRDSAQAARQARQWAMAARALIHASRAAEQDAQVQVARTLLDEAQPHLRQAGPSHETAYNLIQLGRAYDRLAPTFPDLTLQADAALQQAAKLAEALPDPRALSYAWGYRGRLYEEVQRYEEALTLTRQAVWAAQQVNAPESLYLWQWQSGRLLRAVGNRTAALEAYGLAVESLEAIHTALQHRQLVTQTSFRETVGPLYFEFADLLLQQAETVKSRWPQEAATRHEAYLQRAQHAIEQFKTAELRDYFGDACVAAARPRQTALAAVSQDAAIIYPILLAERTELLVNLPTGLKRVVVSVPGRQIEQRARFLRSALQARDSLRYLQHAQRLYRWLIKPLEADLKAARLQTLVLVPDGALRLIPFAALHDGQHYLIEQYAVAITPSLMLTEPQPLSRETLQVLAAGMTEPAEGFPPLPQVRQELRALHDLYGGTVLLDEAFSVDQLEATLRQGRFGIVHIASHGQFAPDAAASFLLTAHGRLTMTQLAQMVGRLRFRDQPLDLLTFSACETAQGNDRAALGLAGVAIQSGARSALATLWQVSDEASAALMQTFYRHLHEPGVSRARALQQAQVKLLHHERFADPFFWAPFLLINNWL
jgi:CHAT domain-containing protein